MTIRPFILTGLVAGIALAANESSTNRLYDAAAVRDPMLRPLDLPVVTETGRVVAAVRASRRDDIARALAASRIEGVAISRHARMVVINDRLLSEGDAIAPDSAIRVRSIAPNRIAFSLDDEVFVHNLSPPPETSQ
jgi:hypothetical protein